MLFRIREIQFNLVEMHQEICGQLKSDDFTPDQ